MIEKIMTMLTQLLDKKIVTASYLAKLLGVSTRTIYRYVDVLSCAGVPVYAKNGKGGGICIGEEYKLASTTFARSEMEFLRDISINISSEIDKIKYSNLISKIGSVNCTLQQNISSSSLYIQDGLDANSKLTARITSLEFAINNLLEVSITYVGRSDRSTSRTIRPLNFVLNNNEWYIYAYCMMKCDLRVFKLSRIINLTTLCKTFTPITNYEKSWKFDFNDGKQLINLIINISPHIKYDVEEWLGIESVKKTDDGKYIASAERYLDNDLIYKLLSFGDEITIIEPKLLIEEYNSKI